MYTFDEIVSIIKIRQDGSSVLLQRMLDVKERYNGDYVIPLPTMEGEPILPPLTPALIAENIDAVAQRAASVMPFIGCPAVDPSKERGVRSREYADIRRRALAGTWYQSKYKVKIRRAYRHLAGYATSCILVSPDFDKGIPRIDVRDPLGVYPEPKAYEDVDPPANCGFIHGKSGAWIRSHYPNARQENGGVVPPDDRSNQELWDMIEWIDDEHIVIGIMGPRYEHYNQVYGLHSSTQELSRAVNKAGMPCVITPGRITLDRIASSISNIVGIVDLMSKMMALEIIAQEKAIFPDRYIIGRSGQVPMIVGGEWKDGREGQVNVLLDAESIGELRSAPDPSTNIAIDRLERNARISTGTVPQIGGETYGALRTGRGIDALMGAALDPRIQEMQEIMEAHLPYMNECIFASYKGYFGRKKFSMYTGYPGDFGQVEFTPREHFEINDNVVSHSIPGADIQGTTIQLGQLLSMKGISLRTFRTKHPFIEDAEMEGRRVDEEQLEEAVLAAIQQQALSGQLPVVYVSKIEKHRKKGLDIFEAIEKADEEIRQEQAAQAPPPGEGQMMAPEQALGLAAGPEGAAQQGPQGPPGFSPESARQMVDALRTQ
ncbi:hypothetical protein CMI37_32575 [Candidatus Pacearchaeota archaeon]|nr:hypothetical protein [Candidatus Pacearchaeota archaeon]